MDSKKRITISACVLFIMLGLLVNGIVKTRDEKETSNTSAPVSSVIQPEAKEDEQHYIMKIEDGIVVVFSDADTTRPIMVTDIYASTLRNYDREELERGISVENERELHALLEDYSS